MRYCAMFLTLLVSYQLAPVRITAIIPSSEYTVYENYTIQLTCYIEGDPTPSVEWRKVGGKFSPLSPGLSNPVGILRIT